MHTISQRQPRLAALLFLIFLSGCGNVQLHDEVFYANKGMLGAVSFHTLTKDSQTLTMEQWFTLLKREPLICSSVTTFGDIKIFVEQVCSICNCCNVDTTKAAEEFFQNIKDAEAVPIPKRN